MSYLKERNKMIILLVLGLALVIGVLFFLNSVGRGHYVGSFSGLFLVLAVICYPLAISYGRGQMIDIFQSIRMGARQPFRARKINSAWGPIFSVLNFIIALLTLIFFGWVYGAYTAYQKLQMMKSFHVK